MKLTEVVPKHVSPSGLGTAVRDPSIYFLVAVKSYETIQFTNQNDGVFF